MTVYSAKNKRKLTEIEFKNNHYLANLLAITKYLGLSLANAKKLCKHPDIKIAVDPPIEISSDLDTDVIFDKLDEYDIVISVTVSSK